MCVAAGIAAGAVGAAIIGGIASNKAADKGASAVENASDANNAMQRYMYDTTRQDNMGRMVVGDNAMNAYARLMGVNGYVDPSTVTVDEQAIRDSIARPENVDSHGRFLNSAINGMHSQNYETAVADAIDAAKKKKAQEMAQSGGGNPDYSAFFDSPDYKFSFDEGQRAVNGSLAARGLGNSGAALKELTRYGQGAASQNLGNYAAKLASLAGIAQPATNAVSSVGANAANNIGNSNMQAADARASSYMTRANSFNNMINQGAGAYTLSQLRPQTQQAGTGGYMIDSSGGYNIPR